MNTKYQVEAARSMDLVTEGQCDHVIGCETLRESKAKARELIREGMGYARVIEHSSPGYRCVADFFGK